MNRIGLFGGTFDPVHYGHLRTVDAARMELNLDRVLMLPNPRPPHKLREPLTPYEHRKAMLELALQEFPALELSNVEEFAEGPAYTTDTVRRVIAALPKGEHELWLIVGADALIELPHWKDPEALFRDAKVAVLPRMGFDFKRVNPAYLSRVCVLHSPEIPISATDIRKRLREGIDVKGMLADAVLDYIRNHWLYQ
ncbi:nicotinate (nicotinamide) nucleotide adenylyltransferase [candidate division KSB1 bacterium]|nr:MAG: nicotinate (nicotinamide) nucleotide adenylyltransferase [candidate division KSB1 bacterium]